MRVDYENNFAELMRNREHMAALSAQCDHLRGLVFCNLPNSGIDDHESCAANADDLATYKELEQCIEHLQSQMQRKADQVYALYDRNVTLQSALAEANDQNEVLRQEKHLLRACEESASKCQHAIAAQDIPRYIKQMTDNHEFEVQKLTFKVNELEKQDSEHIGNIMQEELQVAELRSKNDMLVKTIGDATVINEELIAQLRERAFGSHREAAEAYYSNKLDAKQTMIDEACKQIGELKYINNELELQIDINEWTVRHWQQKHRGIDIQNTRNAGIVKAMEKRYAADLAVRPLDIDLRNYNEDFSDDDVQLLAQVDERMYRLVGMEVTKAGAVGQYDDSMF